MNAEILLRLIGDPLPPVHASFVSLSKTKRNLLYIRNQSVPRCKHFQPGLFKDQT